MMLARIDGQEKIRVRMRCTDPRAIHTKDRSRAGPGIEIRIVLQKVNEGLAPVRLWRGMIALLGLDIEVRFSGSTT
jgi:hypothetical protein